MTALDAHIYQLPEARQTTSERYALGALGLPGTGKSTLIAVLASSAAPLRRVETDEAHATGAMLARYIERLFVERDTLVALRCQCEALFVRCLMQLRATRFSLIDEPVEAVLAHSIAMADVGLLEEDEFATWLKLYALQSSDLPQPSALVLLQCDRDELRERWLARGRSRDSSVSNQYLDAFDQALHEVAEHTAKRLAIQVQEIDTTRSAPLDIASRVASAGSLHPWMGSQGPWTQDEPDRGPRDSA